MRTSPPSFPLLHLTLSSLPHSIFFNLKLPFHVSDEALVAAVFLAVVTLSWISISTFMFKNVSLAISQIIASVGRRKPPGEKKKKVPQKFFKIYALQQLIILPLSQPFHPPAINLALPLSEVSVPLGPVVTVCQSFSFSVYSQHLLSDPL